MDPTPAPQTAPRPRDAANSQERIASAFERTVDEGLRRVRRTWPALLATGTIGGLDVGVGLLAFLVVLDQTHDQVLAALAFGVGFIALSLANSELFTENFLVPIAARAAERASTRSVGRLWVGTAVTNLIGGWVLMFLVVTGLPHLRPLAVTEGTRYVVQGIGAESFCRSVLAGMVITLMTWMEHSTESVPAKLVAVVAAAFVLASAPLDHAVVGSLQMFGALQAGAGFGYADWFGLAAWMALGNAIGGIGLVTVLRLVQVGSEKLEDERAHAPEG